MINELNLSPIGYVIFLLVLAVLFYLIATTDSKIDIEETVEDSKDTETPEYLSRYGAVIQMQGRD